VTKEFSCGMMTLVMLLSSFALGAGAVEQMKSDPPPKGFGTLRDKGFPAGKIEFESPSKEFPPRPKGYRESKPVPFQTIQVPATEGAQQFQRLALEDDRVRQALGKRYVHITTGPVSRDKAEKDAAPEATLVRYYGYEKGNTVDVIIGPDNRVRTVQVVRGLQPPETPEEIKAAHRIALQTSNVKERIKDLSITGILSEPQAIGLPQDQRVIYLTFRSPNNEIVHVAWVNLTAQQIIKEGPPPTER